MKRFAVFVAVFFFAIAPPVEAQVESSFAVGPRIGIDLGDVEEVFIGGEARFSSADFRLVINPTFDYYLTEDPLTVWSLSTNVLYPFGAENVENQVFVPYAGVGLGIYRVSLEGQAAGAFGASSSDLGANVLFGGVIPGGAVAPFAEAQYSPVFAEDNYNIFSIKAGLLLGF